MDSPIFWKPFFLFFLLGITLGVSKPLMRCCVLNVLSGLRMKCSRTLYGDWKLRPLDVFVVSFWGGWLCANLRTN